MSLGWVHCNSCARRGRGAVAAMEGWIVRAAPADARTTTRAFDWLYYCTKCAKRYAFPRTGPRYLRKKFYCSHCQQMIDYYNEESSVGYVEHIRDCLRKRIEKKRKTMGTAWLSEISRPTSSAPDHVASL